MLNWLKTKPDLHNLRKYEGLNKVDVRDLDVTPEEMYYLKVNITSLVSGQLSSWKIYPQHKLPIDDTMACYDKIQSFSFSKQSYLDYEYKEGDLLFIDPPYLNTKGNYSKNSLNLDEFIDWVSSIKAPKIITYKEPIKEIVGDWNRWLIKKVPNVRKGGTLTREDWYVYIQ